jgi:hypothetical protein
MRNLSQEPPMMKLRRAGEHPPPQPSPAGGGSKPATFDPLAQSATPTRPRWGAEQTGLALTLSLCRARKPQLPPRLVHRHCH